MLVFEMIIFVSMLNGFNAIILRTKYGYKKKKNFCNLKILCVNK